MSRIIVIVGIFLAAVGVGTGAIIAGGGILGSDPPPLVDFKAIATVPLEYEIPSLSEEEIATITELVSASRDVQGVIPDRELSIKSIAVWHHGPNKLGARVIMRLDSPATLEKDWPVVRNNEDSSNEDSSIVVDSARYLAVDITEVLVSVDLRQADTPKVIELRPLEFDAEASIWIDVPVSVPIDGGD